MWINDFNNDEEKRALPWFWKVSAQFRSTMPLRIMQRDTGRVLWMGLRGNMPPAYNSMQMVDSMDMVDGVLTVYLDVDEDFVRAQYKSLGEDAMKGACWPA